ncbi:helix-turn-helix transcriptional regulator [Bordetella genomosp. 13]|uniref:Helix-turn-helix transcriptional regulator n=1 Tax=Bordetella genomosp. 13 TaxID=463040 RepID=A0A1W6ZHL0_9BORD|nr:helix-turn-helix transcriptional regulator [Bordetella genomosp. 13]ARP96640.1 helix-turn-helix transcriptional regulator [Bordetella genomosp. 13]
MKQLSTVFTAERRHLLEIIDGLVEGILLLDLNRHIAWANDTALAMHGAVRLADLGGTAAGYRKAYTLRYRNQRKLLASQYPIDRALAGEPFKDVVVEVAKRNADFCRVHQVRNLVLNDAQGLPEGAALILLDVTERYGAEERFEKTFNANPAPALICSLHDMRYVKVNQGFLHMTGYARQDVLGHSVSEVDVLGDAPQRDEAALRLKEGRTIAQMETCIRLPNGADKLVVVAGQPIEIGEMPCMLFTFNDLEPRRRAENALRDSEERFSKAFRLAPVPMVFSTTEGRVVEVNDAFVETTGYTVEILQELGAPLARLCSDPASCEAMMRKLAAGAGMRGEEMQLRTHDGVLLDCMVSADTVVIQGQQCILCVIQDLTERKRSETELMAAIEAVMQDTSWFSHTVIEKLAQIRQPQGASGPDTRLADLTPREREILGLMCQGLDDPGIAQALSVSRHTVRNHVASLYNKLQVHRRSAAIVWARERGIVGYDKPARRRRTEQ